MPYPHFHACRIRQPGEFQKKSFRNISRGGLQIIIGRLKGKTTTTTQSIRYPTSSWNEAKARADCKDKGGTFEAAKKAQEFSDEYGLE